MPGTPTARWPRVLGSAITLPCLVEEHVGRGRERRGLAEIDESPAAVGELHGHESAAAEVAGRRIHHGQRVAHGDRRIDRIAVCFSTSTPTRVACAWAVTTMPLGAATGVGEAA